MSHENKINEEEEIVGEKANKRKKENIRKKN